MSYLHAGAYLKKIENIEKDIIMANAFTIRSIPVNLHKSWKVVSSLKDISMRLYILRALRKQVEKDIDALEKTTLKKHDLEDLN